MVAPDKSGTLSATTTVRLGVAAGGRVCSWLLQISTAGSWSVQPTGVAANSTGQTGLNMSYKNMVTGAAGTAALTANGAILIDGSGMDVSVTFTRTSGDLDYFAVPVLG